MVSQSDVTTAIATLKSFQEYEGGSFSAEGLLSLALLFNKASDMVTQADVSAAIADIKGLNQFQPGSYSAEGLLNLALLSLLGGSLTEQQKANSGIPWTHLMEANPTTQPDGSPLVVGDQIFVPSSVAKPGLWDWNGVYWLGPTQKTFQGGSSSFWSFLNANGTATLSIPAFSSFITVARIDHRSITGTPSDTNFFSVAVAPTDVGGNAQSTIATGLINQPASSGRSLIIPINTYLGTTPAFLFTFTLSGSLGVRFNCAVESRLIR